MGELVPLPASALTFLPRDFDAQTRAMSEQQRKTERRERLAAFNTQRAQLRNWVRQDRNPLMNARAKLVCDFLLECVNFEKGWCFPSHELIADHLGICDRQVRRLMKRIEQAGWIKPHRARRNMPTFYTFHAPAEDVKRIEQGALELKESRIARREERRFQHMIDHEPVPANGTEMSGQPQFDRTFSSTSDRTSVSGEHLNGTPPMIPLIEEKEPSKVSAASLSSPSPAASSPNPYEAAKGGSDSPIPIPSSQRVAEFMVDEWIGRTPRPKRERLRGALKRQLMAGNLFEANLEAMLALADKADRLDDETGERDAG